LTRVAGVEAVEIIEAETIGPAVEWANLARLPNGCVVVLADPGSGVAVLPQDFGDSAGALSGIIPT
jgi:hypothetical protein